MQSIIIISHNFKYMKNNSVWYHDAPKFKDEVGAEAEVIVVGGGLLGLLTAYHLSLAGMKPSIIEALKIGTGTSGHTTGKITSQHELIYHELIDKLGRERARGYARANESAIADYINIIESEGIDCSLRILPARIFCEDEEELEKLVDEDIAARSLGIKSRMIETPFGRALEFEDQAMFQPYDFMIGLAQKLQEKGVAIREGERVVDYKDEGEYCVVETDKNKTYRARYVVLATLAPINEKAFYVTRLQPISHHGMAFEAEANLDAMYLKLEGPTISFRQNKDQIIVIGESMKLGYATDDAYTKLEEEVRKRLKLGKVTHKWSAHDLVSIDKLPLVGNISPISKRIFTATGFRAWGITQSMVSSKIITDLVKGKKDNIYDAWRLQGSFKEFLKQSGHVAKQLLKPERRCTHMGCALSWNDKENTYDCSCHGSRFDKKGNVIAGPATRALDK